MINASDLITSVEGLLDVKPKEGSGERGVCFGTARPPEVLIIAGLSRLLRLTLFFRENIDMRPNDDRFDEVGLGVLSSTGEFEPYPESSGKNGESDEEGTCIAALGRM